MRIRSRREGLLLAGLLLGLFLSRSYKSGQPILENYVGRQVPTAMVARNLARGSGFLSPELDTGPLPNLFLVEPPVFAWVVARLATATGLPLDPTGRVISALATTLAGWGLFGLVRARASLVAAIGSLLALAAFPVAIRYGRAFQPDALAMGLTVAGLRCSDDEERPVRRWLGFALLAIGIAQKVTWSCALVPLFSGRRGSHPTLSRLAILATLVPALAWYAFAAATVTGDGPGTAASADNAANWATRLAPSSFLEAHRYAIAARDLVVRSFTPIGFGLLLLGASSRQPNRRFFRAWGLGASAVLLVLFGKLHHDYYWLLLAPPAAAMTGLAIDGLPGRWGWPAATLLLIVGVTQAESTWRTPSEWRGATDLAAAIRRHVPRDALVIAPEAILYLGDRRGCRLEWTIASARRAANEWRPGPPFAADTPGSLVAFYRETAGATYFADVESSDDDPARARLHDAARRLPGARVIAEEPGRFLLLKFEEVSPERSGPGR